MAAKNQDFETFAGDAAVIVFTVTDQPNGAGNPVDLSTCSNIVVTVARNFDDQTATVLTKQLSDGGITLVAGGTTGKFALNIANTDAVNLSLTYAYMAVTTDDVGNRVTVATGQWTVKPKPTASYSGDPAQSQRDYIRSLVGDADVDNPLFTDQVYDNLISDFGGALNVAAQVCRMLAAKYSSKASKRVGDLSITFGDLSKNYLAQAAEYQAQSDKTGTIMYAAGINRADRNGYREQPGAIKCFTTIDAFDNRGGAYGGFAPDNLGGN